MAATLTTYTDILKVRYLWPIREQLNNSLILWNKIKKDSSTISVSGKTFTVPLHSQGNLTAGSGRAENAALPTAGNQDFDQAIVPCKYLYTGIQITGPGMAATRDNTGAFAQMLDTEVSGATRDMKKSLNRQMHGDGKDALAYWTAADDTTTANVDDGRGNAFTYMTAGKAMVCDVIDATDHSTVLGNSISLTLGGTSTARTVAWSAGTISGTADGDYVVLEDTLGYQLMGLEGIISDDDPVVPAGGGALTGLHSLAVATYPYWVAQVVGNSGTNRALTFDLMQQPLDMIVENSDYLDTDVQFMLCSPGVRRKYVELLVADRRHVNTLTLDGGFKGLDYNGIPLIVDPQCKKNRIYYINPESLRIMTMSDIDWMDKDGNVLSRSSGYDRYDATLYFYGDLACVTRNANGVLEDVTE